MKKRFLLRLFITITLAGVSISAGASYYAELKVTGGATGKGYVYGAMSKVQKEVIYTADEMTIKDGINSEGTQATYYIWAKPCRGTSLLRWDLAGNGSPQSPQKITGSADKITVKRPTSSGTNTAEAKAIWSEYKPCTLYLHSSEYGAYHINIKYTDYDVASKFFKNYSITEVVPLNVSIEKKIILYCTDTVTLFVDKGIIEGWYQSEGDLQSSIGWIKQIENTSTYHVTVPSGTDDNAEIHIYPKFAKRSNLYSRLNVQYAVNSAKGAGKLAVTAIEGVDYEYSATDVACNLQQTSLVEDGATTTTQQYYLHAKTNNLQYCFVGWYSSQNPSQETLISSDAEYTYELEGVESGTEAEPTEETIYAMFARVCPHYFEMTAEPATAGLGMVYVSQTKETNLDYNVFTNHSQILSEEFGRGDVAVNTEFYLYAKPKYGYRFEGWYSDAECQTRVSADNPYNASARSTDPNNPDKAHVYAKFIKADLINITFNFPTNGAYAATAIDIVQNSNGEYVLGEIPLYDSNEEASDKTVSIYPVSEMILAAKPKEGYAVKSWNIAGTQINSASTMYSTSAVAGKAYGITFGESSPFKVGDKTFTTLDAAIEKANEGPNKTIIVVEDATVPKGEYIITEGVTLLIPKDGAQTSPIGPIANRVTSKVSPKKNVCLTLDEGVVITVNGVLEVSCDENVEGQGATGVGVPSGPYGQIDMKENSAINIESGASLMAWGFITGVGKITAKSGSTIYEMFQIMDWKGGTASSGMIDNPFKILPVCQYAIQNIEAPIRFQYGSKEIISTGVNLKIVGQCVVDEVVYIGSNGMFELNDDKSWVEKRYNPINDKQIYTINGAAKLSDFELNLHSSSQDISIITAKYRLPLMNNFVVNIMSGTTTINVKSLVMAAGSEINIAKGATLSAPNEFSLYDEDEWEKIYAYNGQPTHSVPYSPTKQKNHGVTDAKLNIEGGLQVGGQLYTSKGGAALVSSTDAAGTIQFSLQTSTENILLYQYTTANANSQDGKIATPARLKNADGSYTETAGDAAGTTYVYFLGKWRKDLKINENCLIEDNGRSYASTASGYKAVEKSSTYNAAWQDVDATSVFYVHTTDESCDWVRMNEVKGSTKYLQDNDGFYHEYSDEDQYWIEAEIGTPLDIVDWNTADKKMTVNFNGVPASIWPLKIKVGEAEEVEYAKEKRNPDRTMDIPYSGEQGSDLKIKVTTTKDGVSTIYSQHSYVIPYVYDADATLSDLADGHSIIFVRKGKLTVNQTVNQTAKVGAIYVAPGAELEISSGATLTVDSLMLRTTPWEAAILTNNGTIKATRAYYTRIVKSNSQYYQFALPLAFDVNAVHLSNYANIKYGTTWLLKRYSEQNRATQGAGGKDEWLPLEAGETSACAGYEMFSNTGSYYCEYYFPVTLPTSVTTDLTVTCTTNNPRKVSDEGWNALCSPLLGKYTQKIAAPSSAIKVSLLTESGNYYQCIPEVIYPAVPFYYQAPRVGTLKFSGNELILKAPQRAWNTSVSEQWLRLTIHNATGAMCDETNIFVHPEKFSADYEPGYDVAKQSLTASTAVLYSSWPCGPLAFAAIPDSVAADRIPLTVSAGKAGEYTFSLQDNNYLERLDHVFLYDAEMGAVTDLLGDDYTIALPQGTAAGRFYIRCVFAPVLDITTDIVPASTEDMQTNYVQKFLYNDRVYILRNGVFYDLTGRPCELQ